MWKKLTVTVARDLVRKYDVNIVVPMTIYNKEYFDYIYNGFREIDKHTYHFCLSASLDTIHKRLEKRGEVKDSRPFEQTTKCLKSFNENNFTEYIDTEFYTVNEIVDIVLKKVILNPRVL